jgi:SAM-dependent methyltransferase
MNNETKNKISPRLDEILSALPLWPGIRVLEIGCGPGVAAREIARRIKDCYILAVDRSEKAIQQAIRNSKIEIASGRLNFRRVAVENLQLRPGEPLFDIAFAIRVGALDGRHPEIGQVALPLIAKVLTLKGKLFIDGGNPLQEIKLDEYRTAAKKDSR